NGYKQDKYEKLCSMAVRAAKSVQRSKVDVLLDPMPNDERKAIHNYLTNMHQVRTVSEGEGNQRRIRIVYDANKK
ncbi:MAG: R3H domain-containing nucleic acid-binding protein, partial [Erysipelotrichaceae bacterium]